MDKQQDQNSHAAPRCGFIALLGAPNAGKSTLINRIVGSKLSIVSPKPQTTRTRILGVAMAGAAQLVFLDLPGVFMPKRKLERAMVEAAWEGARTADVILVMVDAARGELSAETQSILRWLKSENKTAILVLNKIDSMPKARLLELTKELTAEGLFTDVFMISAKTGDGVDDVIAALVPRMPEGEWQYPEDQLTDMPERLWAAEITREQVFLQLREELPYAAAVETETWQEKADGSVAIGQVVYVQKESQRAIVLGKGGARIREIGQKSRLEMAAEMERPVHLTLHIKVKENWVEDIAFLKAQGLLGQE